VAKRLDGATFLFCAMNHCSQAKFMADAAAAGRGTLAIKVGRQEAGGSSTALHG
jgi:hypothetical protein